MKVCVDAQAAVSQRAGIGRYTRSLLENIGEFRGGDEIEAAYFDFRGKAAAVPRVRRRRIWWCPGRLAQYSWKRLDWPPYDWLAGAADLYHFPNYVIPPLSRGRAVATIHDMSFRRFPEFTEPRNIEYLDTCIPRTLERAAAIITDSRFSAREITELLGVEPQSVFPIHLGVDENMRNPGQTSISDFKRRAGIEKPYILAVGTLEPRKNWRFLIDVFEKMTDFNGLLIIAGMTGWKYEPILARIESSPRKRDITRLEYPADQDMPALYSGAELLIFPSVYEGFGLPPLEAMACGTPALASALEVSQEVLGDAAAMLGGFNAEEWAASALRLLRDRDALASLSAKGVAQAAKYTWRETARLTWDVYRRVMR